MNVRENSQTKVPIDVYESWGTHTPESYMVLYTWTLENFALLKEVNEHLDQMSPKFPDENFFKTPNDIKFHLKLNEDEDSLGLCVVPTCPKDYPIKWCKIVLTLSNNEQCKKTSSFNIRNGTYMWFPIHKYSDLFAPDSIMLPDGKLIIRVEISIMGKVVCNTGVGNPLRVPKCKLSEDYGVLLQTGALSDVEINTADGYKLKAHRAILSGNT